MPFRITVKIQNISRVNFALLWKPHKWRHFPGLGSHLIAWRGEHGLLWTRHLLCHSRDSFQEMELKPALCSLCFSKGRKVLGEWGCYLTPTVSHFTASRGPRGGRQKSCHEQLYFHLASFLTHSHKNLLPAQLPERCQLSWTSHCPIFGLLSFVLSHSLMSFN